MNNFGPNFVNLKDKKGKIMSDSKSDSESDFEPKKKDSKSILVFE